MEIIYSLVGGLIGALAAYLIFVLRNGKRQVDKKDYEALVDKSQASNTSLQIEIEKNKTLEKLKLSLLEEKVQLQKELFAMHPTFAAADANNKSLTQQLQTERESTHSLRLKEQQLNSELRKIAAENSSLLANNSSLSEKMNTQKDEILSLQKKAQLEFEKIANKLFEEKSSRFTQANKENIEALLKPLGENINHFKKRVEETYDKESKERFSLGDRIKELVQQTNKVSAEANNLAAALKGQTKKQGDWGEMILESILQQSGLVKDREYFLQQNIKDETGKNLRPDVLIKLPDSRSIIIDSKVSLVAYDRYCNAETQQDQAVQQAAHLKSLYSHIDNLHSKNYDQLEDALDFTMLFVPIEPAYLLCIQADAALWSYAYAQRILLISPTNLIACLKLMADLWKREQQSKNAMEIVKRGELMYEKFVTFVTTLEDLGHHIQKSQTAYTAAISQLNAGKGHLVGQALKLKNLGLKSSKEIPKHLLEQQDE